MNRKILLSLFVLIFLATQVQAGWLSGYGKRKSVALVAASPASAYNTATTWTSSQSATDTTDTYMTSYFATNPDGSNQFISIDPIASNVERDLVSFDLSGYTGGVAHISKVTITLRYYGGWGTDPVGRSLIAYKCKRAFAAASACWNYYTGTTAWGTAGCSNTTSDYDSAIHSDTNGTIPASGSAFTFEVTTLAKDAINNDSGKIMRLMLKDTSEGGATDYGYNIYSTDAATSSYRPKVTIYYNTTSTPTVPANYKTYLNIYRGGPTVETGTWTVNSKAYHYRVPFPIQVNTAISSVYAQEMFVNTQALVTGGFFASSTYTNAYSVEFADSDGANTLKYCLRKGFLKGEYFNTVGSCYILGLNGFSANTTYTRYMYLDPAVTTQSTNYDPNSVFTFYDDFSTDVANATAFFANAGYGARWAQEGGSHLTLSVASGVLSVASSQASEWNGIAAKTFTAQNCRTWISQYTGNNNTWAGMLNTGGITSLQSGYGLHQTSGTPQFTGYFTGTATNATTLASSFGILTFFDQYNGENRMVGYKCGLTGDVLDQGFMITSLATNPTTDLKPCIDAYTSSAISINWIAVSPSLLNPPLVVFPDITYEQSGSVYLNNQCLNWPYDIKITKADGVTPEYTLRSALSQLMKQPDLSTQESLRVPDDLTSNQSVYVYYKNSAVATDHAYMSGSSTYGDSGNVWEDGTSYTDFTTVSGSWAAATVQEPILSKGTVGNTNRSQGGALWARMPGVVKWTDNKYYMIYCNSPWEIWALWPFPDDTYISRCDTLGTEFTTGHRLNLSPQEYINYPICAKVWNSKAYIFNLIGDTSVGVDVYSTSDLAGVYNGTSTATRNTNGPFFNKAWMAANTGSDFTSYQGLRTCSVVLDGSTYRVFIYSIVDTGGGTTYNGKIAYFTTTVAPESWNPTTSFTYVGKINLDSAYFEDGDFAYDGSRYWYFYAVSSSSNLIRYKTLDTNSQTFPTGTWSSWTTVDATLPPFMFNETARSPRLLLDGSTWHLFLAGAGEKEVRAYWIPNWVAEYSYTSLAGPWTALNTATKIYESTFSNGTYYRNYVTTSSLADGEITTELQLNQYDTADADYTDGGGIVFRYNSTNDTGYAAVMSVARSGTTASYITVYKFTGSTYTQLGSQYTIPTSPVPGFYKGYPARLRVRLYGESIHVDYSLWGNIWTNNAVSTSDPLYLTGKVGMITSGGKCYFKNFRAGPYIETAPATGTSQIQNQIKSNRPVMSPSEGGVAY
jgi:hypothetical protein